MAADFVLSAPPSESRQQSERMYQPIAALLSEITGKQVEYQYPGYWPTYTRNMQQSKYDFLIDAPHFVSWRIEKIEHRPLVSLSNNMIYVVVSLEDSNLNFLEDLKGKSACSSAIPDLDALTLLDQYESPWTQPTLSISESFEQRFEALQVGRCAAAIFPQRVYAKLNRSASKPTRVLFQSQQLPHLGLSASPRVPSKLLDDLHGVLLSDKANNAFFPLQQYYGLSTAEPDQRVSADADAYRGYTYLLEEFWGF